MSKTAVVSKQDEIHIDRNPYDGVHDAYVPPAQLKIDPSLQLSRDTAATIDPITYEVLRHNLWSINEEHGVTILRVSGSPIAAYGCDFNPCLLTEDAEFVYVGPYMQFFCSQQDLTVKWALENRSANPGIEEGDMFLSNDCWIGASHQLDANLICPVFHEGKLFCWVVNALHFAELGGSVAGGWNPIAQSRFEEPPLAPCVKIVERGRLRRDLDEWWSRNSRMPETVSLDLRAVIAGAGTARERIEGLIARYGAPVVKKAMRRIIDDSASMFSRRMERIPDGVWRERAYVEVANPGDRGVYETRLTMRKEGDRLTFDSLGTHPEVGAINVTYAGWRGGILAVLASFLVPDAMYALGGAVRNISFNPAPGTLLNAGSTGSVANGSIIGVQIAIAMANNTVGRALHTDPDQRRRYTANGGATCWPIVSAGGTDQRGKQFQNIFLDFYASPLGAFTFRDGIDTGGPYWMAKTVAPNVEQNEQVMPVMYTWQKEVTDSAGAGKYVGGSTIGIGFTAWGSEDVVYQVAVSGVTQPTALGLYGGMPGSPNSYLFRENAGTIEEILFPDSRLSADDDGTRAVSPKESDLRQRTGDVLEVVATGAAGIGDPLERDPEAVLADIAHMKFSPEVAAELFGVAIEDGVVDAERTEQLRTGQRRQRLEAATAGKAYEGGEIAELHGELTSTLRLGSTIDGRSVICSGYSEMPLCAVDENYKLACARLDLPITSASPLATDPAEFVDPEMQFRLFLCPQTGGLIETEVAFAGQPPLHDIGLDPDLDPTAFGES
jgi:N-methylhydantoinase B